MDNKISPAASAHLDLIRALTAVAVAAGHIRSLFFVDYEALGVHTFADKFFYFFTGLGHQGVIVFFVLSGLLVGGSVLKSAAAKIWSLKTYAIARLSRLYVVLVPGLFLTWILDSIGMAVTHRSFIYAGSPIFGNVVGSPVWLTHTFRDFFGTLFFLQNILVKPFGSDAPLWSLANEFWYYAAFPLIVFAAMNLFKKGARMAGLACALSALAIFSFVGWDIASLFPVWLFGVGAIVLAMPRRQLPAWAKASIKIIALLIIAAAIFAARLSIIRDPLLADLALGLAVAVGLWAILSFSSQMFGKFGERYARLSKGFAGFSYTLYVIHLPFIIFIHGMISAHTDYFSAGRWHPDAPHLAAATAIFAAVLAYAYGIALLTEKHTPWIRQKARAWFS